MMHRKSNLSYTLRLGYIYTIMETELLYEPFRPAGPQVNTCHHYSLYSLPALPSCRSWGQYLSSVLSLISTCPSALPVLRSIPVIITLSTLYLPFRPAGPQAHTGYPVHSFTCSSVISCLCFSLEGSVTLPLILIPEVMFPSLSLISLNVLGTTSVSLHNWLGFPSLPSDVSFLVFYRFLSVKNARKSSPIIGYIHAFFFLHLLSLFHAQNHTMLSSLLRSPLKIYNLKLISTSKGKYSHSYSLNAFKADLRSRLYMTYA